MLNIEAIKDIVVSLKYVIFAALIAFALLYGYVKVKKLNEHVNSLKVEMIKKDRDFAYLKLENERLLNSTNEQNKEIELLKLNEKLNLEKLKKWKKQKPEIRYKTITKFREVKSDECETLKSTIDAVKHIDFTSL